MSLYLDEQTLIFESQAIWNTDMTTFLYVLYEILTTDEQMLVLANWKTGMMTFALRSIWIFTLCLPVSAAGLVSGWTNPHPHIPEQIEILTCWRLPSFLSKYLLYAYQYLLLGLYPDEQILILTSPAQVHVGESVYSLAEIIIKNIIYFCEGAIDWTI
jgi:hypothetical protein